MLKTPIYSITFAILAAAGLGAVRSVHAADIEWSGVYRFEANHMKNLALDKKGAQQDYGLHHLSLRPKIVAGDGLTIFGQFELLNSGDYPNSQLGQTLGGGFDSDPAVARQKFVDDAETMDSEAFLISQLYLSWTQEYGALLVGRAPIHFGLGATHNAGRGMFDHWFDTRDLVAYKVIFGNLWLMPMYGKYREGSLHKNDDVNDFMVQAQYENPETDIEMGVFYQVRKSSDRLSSLGTLTIATPAAPETYSFGEIDSKTLSLYVLKDTERFRVGLEGTFLDGQSGLINSTAQKVTLSGFGVAGEFEYRPDQSKWVYGLKAGSASGDDPDSTDSQDGFAFNRNYDVAMLLFNRPMGRQDVLTTRLFGGGPDVSDPPGNQPDTERISNVTYLAPYFVYNWKERWKIGGVFATGWLSADPVPGQASVDKDLGYELDLSLTYSPRKGLLWVNEMGMLIPGGAFRFNNEDPKFGYGLTSKAAISF